jgi:hypothetical protein
LPGTPSTKSKGNQSDRTPGTLSDCCSKLTDDDRRQVEKLWNSVVPSKHLHLEPARLVLRFVGPVQSANHELAFVAPKEPKGRPVKKPAVPLLSDGERRMLHYLTFMVAQARLLLGGGDSGRVLVVVDEPETYLHPGMARQFWNHICGDELFRGKFVFMFITHDIAFAQSLTNCQVLVLAGSFSATGARQYVFPTGAALPDAGEHVASGAGCGTSVDSGVCSTSDFVSASDSNFAHGRLWRIVPVPARSAMLGEVQTFFSPAPTILCEGRDDASLLQFLFPGCLVKQLGSCSYVESAMEALQTIEKSALHGHFTANVFGVRDRDNLGPEEVKRLWSQYSVACLDGWGAEMTYCCPEVLKAFVAARTSLEPSLDLRYKDLIKELYRLLLKVLNESKAFRSQYNKALLEKLKSAVLPPRDSRVYSTYPVLNMDYVSKMSSAKKKGSAGGATVREESSVMKMFRRQVHAVLDAVLCVRATPSNFEGLLKEVENQCHILQTVVSTIVVTGECRPYPRRIVGRHRLLALECCAVGDQRRLWSLVCMCGVARVVAWRVCRRRVRYGCRVRKWSRDRGGTHSG